MGEVGASCAEASFEGKERGCHPERGRRPGEGPYDACEGAWTPAGAVKVRAAEAVLSAAVMAEIVVGSLTRLRLVRDDIEGESFVSMTYL